MSFVVKLVSSEIIKFLHALHVTTPKQFIISIINNFRSGFWRDRPPRSLDSSIGQFKGGTLKLSSKDIKSFKYKK